MPSPPWTTSARLTPRRFRHSATNSVYEAPNTPITCPVAPAGFTSGPSRLNTVRKPSAFLTGAAKRMAGCIFGAKRNAIPSSCKQCSITDGWTSRLKPSAASTSPEPHLPVAARLPCFATAIPAPAIMKAEVVDMLKVSSPSPPVPTMSTGRELPALMYAARARIARAAPTTSSTVSPFILRAVRNAARICGSTSADIISPKTSALSAPERFAPPAALISAALVFSPLTARRPPSKSFRASSFPRKSIWTPDGTARPRCGNPCALSP